MTAQRANNRVLRYIGARVNRGSTSGTLKKFWASCYFVGGSEVIPNLSEQQFQTCEQILSHVSGNTPVPQSMNSAKLCETHVATFNSSGKIQFIFSNPLDKIQFKVGVSISVRTVRTNQYAF